MILSIFNIFDPMTSFYFMLNWLFMLTPIMFKSFNYWMNPSKWNMLWMLIYKFINNELNLILTKKIYNINFISIFSMILLTNLLGLFSFIFTSSSHMSINLSLSLPFWLSFIILSWIFNLNHTLSHQIPLGTPFILMPFMVMIELISNLIRPFTLSIRLTANMIAGHLLLTLMSMNNNKIFILISIIITLLQTMLMILELSVSIIQSYVFTILLSLYSNE